ncbi:MAG: DDE-type integrase/transposase/recombinase [Clostridia bacterium]|nr:DDE-type integrase/transposase/recombinase [Clostridia bacterium]
MLTESDRVTIALKRFSLISPVLNGQVANQKEYFEKLCAEPIEMPHYGMKNYCPKTLMGWLYDYRQGGLDGLKPGYRADRGVSRKVSLSIAEKIKEKRVQQPRITKIQLYEDLIREGAIQPEKLSQATFYRFLAANPDLLLPRTSEEDGDKELKRFSHQRVNELWQTDLMYGPYITEGRIKKQTYLLAIIDDTSRLIPAAQFSYSQNFSALRVVLKDAILKRGVPKMLYTDNGKIYRSAQLAVVCAGLGCSLIHAQPFTPNAKGKIERFFQTVRLRFLTRVNPIVLKSLEELNLRFWQWLEEDYHRKVHSAIKMSPLDLYMSQADQVTIFSNPTLLEEYFLLRVTRKINHDGTLSVNTILYETEQRLANSRVEVRYDPEWLANPSRPLLLYKDGQKVGEARQVNFHDNAHARRKGPGRPARTPAEATNEETSSLTNTETPLQSISFASFVDNANSAREAGEQ